MTTKINNRPNKNIHIREFLDGRKISGYQILIVVLLFLTIIMDGADVVIMGYIAPTLKEEWGISNQEMAPVLSAALAGLAIGAMFAGPIADKLGRKTVLVTSVFVFGLFTLLSGTSTSTTNLIIYRFIAGLAMGGVMPQAATLITEYSSKKTRALLVTIVFSGFTVGAAGAGFLSSWMLPEFGWQAVLYVCGGVPVLFSIVLFFILPESASFMVLKNCSKDKIINVLNKISPGSVDLDTNFTVDTPSVQGGSPIKTVINKYYLFGSLMLWGGYTFALFIVYLIGSWLPSIIKDSGFTISQAATIGAMFQLGGPLGSITFGWFMDRFNPNRVLALAYLTGGALLIGMSHISSNFLLLSGFAFFVGFCANGANTGMNALSSMFFPVEARATGNSWMHGIGRIGAVISAFAGAYMLDLGWGFSEVALALALPITLVAMALLMKDYYYRPKNVNSQNKLKLMNNI